MFSEVWAEHSVLIDEAMLPIEFSIDGICYRNSTLMIDDIIIQQKKEETSIGYIEEEKNSHVVYSITGVRVTLEYMRSHHGFYIINGKKVYIR